MSAFVKLDTEFDDPQCIVSALADLGYTDVEVHEEAQSLFGYRGDVREQKANIIVRRQHVGSASNDFGFYKEGGKYKLWLSEYDQSTVPRKHGLKESKEFEGLLSQKYSVHRITKQARKNRWRVKVQEAKPGEKIKIKLTAWR